MEGKTIPATGRGRRPRRGRRLLLLACGAAFAAAALPRPLSAQAAEGGEASEPRARGVIAGAVVDARSGAPVPGATVVLQPEVLGAFPGPATSSAFAAATKTATSSSEGAYRFDRLPAGVYRLYVSRVSYRPYSVVVELRGPASATAVSIGLTAEPIPLLPMEARGQPRGPYDVAAGPGEDVDLARLMATDLRRRRYLTADVRELTHADVSEAVTLGEPDVFRALQQLPGVSTRSDYTAELWTRGAPWFQTRVYYDGVPLFNPLHALGVVSGVSTSTVGAVWFHPGVRSASIGEGAAGVVDLQSRPASGGGEVNVQGDVSLMTAGLAVDQRVLDGRAGWMLAGRHTYLDWLADLTRRASGQEGKAYPFSFGEHAGRVDAWVGGSTSLEASWLVERDRLTNEPLDAVEPLRAEWGNSLGRASLTTRSGRLNVRHTVGASRHSGIVLPNSGGSVPTNERVYRLGESIVEYAGVTGSWWPEPSSLAGPGWTFGYALERQGVLYFGPLALPIPRSTTVDAALNVSGAAVRAPLWWAATLPVASGWGEKTWRVDDQLAVRTGLRLDGGPAVANGGRLRVAPRVSARWSVIPEVALSAGLGRSFQYTQAVAPAGVHVASLVATDVWLVAGDSVPAIRADVATVGLEAWLAPGRIVTLNAFGRRSSGVAVPDPRPGPVFDREAFVTGSNEAYGVEVGVRQIVGRVTGSASYSLSRSSMDAAGIEYRAAADRTHVLNATTMVRALPSLRLGGAFTAASGVPFTPMLTTPGECLLEPGCDPSDEDMLPWAGTPHTLRAPVFASLDLLADWSFRHRGTEIGVYGQIRNVLGRENATIYTGDPGCEPVHCGNPDFRNLYEQGIPRLPVIGVRVRR